MPQSVNIVSDSFLRKILAAYTDHIPLNLDVTFYMSVEGLTIIGI